MLLTHFVTKSSSSWKWWNESNHHENNDCCKVIVKDCDAILNNYATGQNQTDTSSSTPSVKPSSISRQLMWWGCTDRRWQQTGFCNESRLIVEVINNVDMLIITGWWYLEDVWIIIHWTQNSQKIFRPEEYSGTNISFYCETTPGGQQTFFEFNTDMVRFGAAHYIAYLS